MLRDWASSSMDSTAQLFSASWAVILLFIVLAGPQYGLAHPLDEVMLEAYDAKAPKSMDVGVMRIEGDVYKVGLFLNLRALFDSVYVPQRLKSEVGYTKEHPAWSELLRIVWVSRILFRQNGNQTLEGSSNLIHN